VQSNRLAVFVLHYVELWMEISSMISLNTMNVIFICSWYQAT